MNTASLLGTPTSTATPQPYIKLKEQDQELKEILMISIYPVAKI